MNDLLAKARVVMTAGATLLTAVVVFITTITPMLPEDWQTVAANIVVGLGAAITFIRRHTPVQPSARGVLPKVHSRASDRGQVHWPTVAITVLIVLVLLLLV